MIENKSRINVAKCILYKSIEQKCNIDASYDCGNEKNKATRESLVSKNTHMF